jgi:hypothetical protein
MGTDYELQATEPQPLAYGMIDNPIRQAAWMILAFTNGATSAHALRAGLFDGPVADQRHDLRHDRCFQTVTRCLGGYGPKLVLSSREPKATRA